MPDQVITEHELQALRSLQEKIQHPERGLPDAVFAFALGIVPMSNVDLVVRDEGGRILWAWREDDHGKGWHIPGSIIRLNETIAQRIEATAANELATHVIAEVAPRAIVQFFNVRGAFLSLVFRCRLAPGCAPRVIGEDARPKAGDLRWFAAMPDAVYPAHRRYDEILPVIAADTAGPPMMLTVPL